METLKYIMAFQKSRLGENLLAFLSILLYIYIYICEDSEYFVY